MIGGLRTQGIVKTTKPNEPLVSIVTVVYNGEETLERTIKSVLAQDYKNIEYLIVDGASNDGTISIIKKYENKIDYYLSEPDSGIYNAMNKGLGLARGDLIGILNADDWYEPNAVTLAAEAYSRSPESISYGLLRYFRNGSEDSILGLHYSGLNKRMITHPTCFVPKNIYQKLGTFDETFRLAADYDFMARAFTTSVSFVQIEKVMANFSLGGACDSNPLRSNLEKIRIYERYGFMSKREIARHKSRLKIQEIRSILKSIVWKNKGA